MVKTSGRVRIAGGALRGRSVAVPSGARPTSGRVREALFSIWQGRLPGARLLELFAGSGVVASEALSRGALSALCVDSGRQAVAALARNRTRLAPGALAIRRLTLPAGLATLAAEDERFDLIFADPPYRFTAYRPLLAAAADLFAPGGELALEHSRRLELPTEVEQLVRTDCRSYGESSLSFYRRLEQG